MSTQRCNAGDSVTPALGARLALGTVQFGLPYGVSNVRGQVAPAEVQAMLEEARRVGIDTLDTAIAYGSAEEVLGQVGVKGFRMVSKVPALTQASSGPADDWLVSQVERSLERLQVPRLAGLMLHAPDDLLGPQGPALARGLVRARDAGLAERIGLSVYSPEQLAAVFDLLPMDILQIPANVFDRRFSDTGWLERLATLGVEVHARSLFLQGLLLMPEDAVPSQFAPFRPRLQAWHGWLASLTPARNAVQACVAHMCSYPGISRLVVGAASLEELRQIAAALACAPLRAPDALASPASPLINPSEWKFL